MTARHPLLRLYPRRWRERYADELAALLDDMKPARRVSLDLIRGAVDAHLHPRRYPMTDDQRAPRWPAWAVLAGSGAVTGLIALSAGLYPANLRDPAAPLLLAVAAALLGVYLILGLRALRRPDAGLVPGLWFGAAAALMWSGEIWAGGPAKLSHSGEQLAGGLFYLLAVLVTLAAGPVSALADRTAGAALRTGMFAGLASGLLVFCFGTVMTLSTLHILASRSDYQHQYATSGAPDMNTFLVGDILTAVTAHLGINLILGLVGGGIGTLISRSRHTGPDNQPDGRPSRPVPPPAAITSFIHRMLLGRLCGRPRFRSR